MSNYDISGQKFGKLTVLGRDYSHKSNTLYALYQGENWCLRTLCTHLDFPYKTAQKRYYRMMKKGLPIDMEKLFKPIDETKIAFKYRK